MKVVEILKLSRNWLELLHNSCTKISDIKYLEMYEEYTSMLKDGHKISYISAHLSEKFHISERQFFYIIKRLSQDCTVPAV